MFSVTAGLSVGIPLLVILVTGIVFLVLISKGKLPKTCPGCNIPHDVSLCKENGWTQCDCCRAILTEVRAR